MLENISVTQNTIGVFGNTFSSTANRMKVTAQGMPGGDVDVSSSAGTRLNYLFSNGKIVFHLENNFIKAY